MKTIEINLDKRSVNQLFLPIRSKADVIVLLMNAVKQMLINYEISDADSTGVMQLQISDMSRLSFFTEDKFFSICFPFFAKNIDDSNIEFYTKNGTIVDNKLSSEILSIVNDNKFIACQDVYEFLEPIDQVEYPSSGLWNVFIELMLFEDGYIRYDHDIERQDPIMHPLNHIDLFYNSSNTFKLGLYKKPNANDFIDILDKTTPCHYLHQHSVGFYNSIIDKIFSPRTKQRIH